MFDKMLQNYKDMAELQAFAEAQYTTIVTLTEQNQTLKEEITHLKTLLESTAPLLPTEVRTERLLVSDEEAISKIQLEKLRDVSLTRELTLEEAKRFEIFYKVLNSVRSNTKTYESSVKKLGSTELLALLEDNNEKK
jgi:hypothetical protein